MRSALFQNHLLLGSAPFWSHLVLYVVSTNTRYSETLSLKRDTYVSQYGVGTVRNLRVRLLNTLIAPYHPWSIDQEELFSDRFKSERSSSITLSSIFFFQLWIKTKWLHVIVLFRYPHGKKREPGNEEVCNIALSVCHPRSEIGDVETVHIYYWPSARWRWRDIGQIMDWNEGDVHKNAGREGGQYLAIMNELAWSIN